MHSTPMQTTLFGTPVPCDPEPPLEWEKHLNFRQGTKSLLSGVGIWFEADAWSEIFSHEKTMFPNGKALCELVAQDCPDELTPLLILTRGEVVQVDVRKTEKHYIVIVNIDDYLHNAKANAARTYVTLRLGRPITGLAELRGLLETPEGKDLVAGQLTPALIDRWAGVEPTKLSHLMQIIANIPLDVIADSEPDIATSIPLNRADGASESDAAISGIDEDILDACLERLLRTGAARRVLSRHTDLILQIVKNDITPKDIDALAYRKQELSIFENMYTDPAYFRNVMEEQRKTGPEAVWQAFFERNPWIFGYGLQYVFTTGFDEKTLEQTVRGFRIGQPGKRPDALLKSRGLISSICLVEIKRADTDLLEEIPHRPGCWAPTSEFVEAISQSQKTVQFTLEEIHNRLDITDSKTGFRTGEVAFLYQPKAFVVIGCLSEFQSGKEIAQERFASFQLFRRNISNPEIITFDELYERARHIVLHSKGNPPAPTIEPADEAIVVT